MTPAFIDLSVISCFANFAEVAADPIGDLSAVEFNCFDYERYWQRVLGTQQCDNLVPDWSSEVALGRAHFVWALAELVRRYEHQTRELSLGAANALLHCSPQFRVWLHQRLAGKAVMSAAAGWLEQHVEHRYMVEEGIAVLVGLAPELFGHQLIFWELMIRTVPHALGEAPP